ncbi:MAG: hypothetical protein DWQ58_07760 [Microcystis aeruginosa TA09]|nr:MAG: hypothetical protein DWQ58_07760 [Microcystis aeruginosa TA09]
MMIGFGKISRLIFLAFLYFSDKVSRSFSLGTILSSQKEVLLSLGQIFLYIEEQFLLIEFSVNIRFHIHFVFAMNYFINHFPTFIY